MAQGGDPTGTGAGNPGYCFADEFSQHTHIAGALSMANSGPDTNGCQFFITYTPQHQLDGKHSVFGQLVEGMDVLEKLESGDVIKEIVIYDVCPGCGVVMSDVTGKITAPGKAGRLPGGFSLSS